MRTARALMLLTAAIVSCGKGAANGSGSTGDGGIMGPTNIVVSWTLAGKTGSASTCSAHGASQIFVNLSGTIDPSLHQSTTVPCAMGSVTFSQLLVQDLGSPYVEGTLLDASGTSVAIVGLDAIPALGNTPVTLAFFAPQGTGGMGGASASSSSSSSTSGSTSSTSSGAGGAGSSSSGSSSASSSGNSTSSSSSSSSSSAASSAGAPDAGDG